jgi:hypothetical protein
MSIDAITRATGITAFLLPLLTGCATMRSASLPTDTSARTAADTPAAFGFDIPSGERAGSGTCRNPAIDPRDGTRLVLARSSEGRGDYVVAAGRYGVRANEYLRLDCRTGATVGVVRR